MKQQLVTLKLSDIYPDPKQPRQEFDPKAMELLKMSIATKGIRQPLIVEKNGKGYVLIDGERRFRAATQIGLKEVPVVIDESSSDLERQIKRFHIQQQHRPWSFFDQARAIKYMVNAGDLEKRDVAEILGISTQRVGELLTLLSLSKRSQVIAETKRIPFSYFTRMTTCLNSLKKETLRPKLETALINKIERGEITKYKELQMVADSINAGGDKIAEKIIKDDSYSISDAVRESKSSGLRFHKELTSQAGYYEARISDALKNNGYKNLTKTQANTLKRISSKLQDYVKLAGDLD